MDFRGFLEYTILMGKNREKGLGGRLLFVAVWIVCFVAVSIVFFWKLDDIKTNLKNTRFFERIFGSTPSFIENHVDRRDSQRSALGEGDTVINIDKISGDGAGGEGELTEISGAAWGSGFSAETDASLSQSPENAATENRQNPAEYASENPAVSYSDQILENSGEKTDFDFERERALAEIEGRFVPKSLPISVSDTENAHEEIQPSGGVETARARLWFITVDPDGRIARKQCVRKVVNTTAPLTNNIKLLLQGPNSTELDSGCMTLIPSGTRLLTAIVKDGVAYLNFSAEFENNRIGVEGFLAQLQQVVFTSTEFATVTSVQVLIDGHKKDTLGDGVWIGSPLSRADFK